MSAQLNSFRLPTLPDRKPEKLQAGLTAIRTGVSPNKSRGSLSSGTVPARTDGKKLDSGNQRRRFYGRTVSGRILTNRISFLTDFLPASPFPIRPLSDTCVVEVARLSALFDQAQPSLGLV